MFREILKILKIAFDEPVSENDYHMVVSLMRKYDNKRISNESEVLIEEGYPISYHPCDHMENVRKCFFCFVKEDNPRVQMLLNKCQDT